MTVTPARIAILGGGALGLSLAQGLAGTTGTEQLVLTVRSAARAAALRTAGFTATALAEAPAANRRAVATAGLIVIAVPPGGVLPLLAEVGSALQPGAVVISLAAAPALEALQAALPERTPILRAMPNTAMATGDGLVTITCGAAVSADVREQVVELFSRVATVFVADETRLTAFAAVLGATAYFPLLAAAVQQAVAGLGFAETDAARIARGIFVGSAAICQEQPEAEFADLIAQVATPGGTTAEALACLRQADFDALVSTAMAASIRKARSLAEGPGATSD